MRRRDLFLTLNDYPEVAKQLHEYAMRRLNERTMAEQEKQKADVLRGNDVFASRVVVPHY